MRLTPEERALAAGEEGPACATAMHIVVRIGELLGAHELVSITSAHIDGCLYHGDSGVAFAERLVSDAGRVRVPTTLNVGALDLLHPRHVRADAHRSLMARRLMAAYVDLGCTPTWTCAPYQVGHRPQLGEHVAWGESNAIAFANSVLGARTERYGDFLDICCALAGRAPHAGLHRDENRLATLVVDTAQLSPSLKARDVFYPVFGAWLGKVVGREVPVVEGLPPDVTEDQLKALGAAASSTGAVGLFHVSGVTPEAPDTRTALGGRPPRHAIAATPHAIREARQSLSTTAISHIDAVALGSPHFSREEFERLLQLTHGKQLTVPTYVCTNRHVLGQLEAEGHAASLQAAGVTIVVDTCVVVTPILPDPPGVLMTNSAKFAHYAPANVGYEVVYGSLEECVASAEAGAVQHDDTAWS